MTEVAPKLVALLAPVQFSCFRTALDNPSWYCKAVTRLVAVINSLQQFGLSLYLIKWLLQINQSFEDFYFN